MGAVEAVVGCLQAGVEDWREGDVWASGVGEGPGGWVEAAGKEAIVGAHQGTAGV